MKLFLGHRGQRTDGQTDRRGRMYIIDNQKSKDTSLDIFSYELHNNDRSQTLVQKVNLRACIESSVGNFTPWNAFILCGSR